MKACWMAGAVVVSVGCGGSASLVLKTPVSKQCASVGLLGCDELSDGVLLYAEGKGREGAEKLQAGAAQNAPEKIKEFAELLETLSNLPGAGKYAGAISEVVATLTLTASSSPTGAPSISSAGSLAELPSSSALDRSARGAVTADTDVAQHRSGLAEIPSYPPEWCAKFGKGTSCLLVARGPLFLTDARAPAADCKGQFLAIISGGQVAVELKSPLSIHGGRILVPTGAALVLGQRPEPPQEPTNSAEKPAEKSADKPDEESEVVTLDDVAPEWSCSLYWSGFVPYSAEPETDSASPLERRSR
jgi:hypothetical protein